MYLRLRQLCLVAAELEPAVDLLTRLFGLGVGFRDENVARYGLVNAVIPIGTSFVEVVAPTRPGTAAGRYLERRGGDGGYMVILDCDDLAERRRRIEAMGVRIVTALSHEGYEGIQLHPRDTGGAMLELNRTAGGAALEGPYHPAGPDWRARRRNGVVTGIAAAELQSREPAALAARWGEILQRKVTRGAAGAPEIALDGARLRFVPDADGRGEGLSSIDLMVADKSLPEAAAKKVGCWRGDGEILAGGVRFRLRHATAAG